MLQPLLVHVTRHPRWSTPAWVGDEDACAGKGEALALEGLAYIAAAEGDDDRAVSLHEESLRLAQQIEDLSTEARVLGNLAAVEIARGNAERADSLLARLMRLITGLDSPDDHAHGLELMAALRAAQGDDAQAASLSGAAGVIRHRMGTPAPPDAQSRQHAVIAALTQRLGDQYHDLAAAGANLDAADAIAEALSAPAPVTGLLAALDDLLASTPRRDLPGMGPL